ncbi:MAG: SPOR domain-containing protein [Acidobacteriota bacterium]
MGRLNPRETFLLFGAMLGFSLLMFAGGIYVGQAYYVEAGPVATESVESPQAEDVKAQLEFYDELMDDSRAKAQPGKTPETAKPGTRDETARQPNAGQEQDDPAPAPAPAPDTQAESTASSSLLPKIEVGYTVQVGAVKSRPDAEAIIEKLEKSGYSGIVVDPEEGGDRYFRVWVGQFATRPEAKKLDERLKADQFKTWVKRVRFP